MSAAVLQKRSADQAWPHVAGGASSDGEDEKPAAKKRKVSNGDDDDEGGTLGASQALSVGGPDVQDMDADDAAGAAAPDDGEQSEQEPSKIPWAPFSYSPEKHAVRTWAKVVTKNGQENTYYETALVVQDDAQDEIIREGKRNPNYRAASIVLPPCKTIMNKLFALGNYMGKGKFDPPEEKPQDSSFKTCLKINDVKGLEEYLEDVGALEEQHEIVMDTILKLREEVLDTMAANIPDIRDSIIPGIEKDVIEEFNEEVKAHNEGLPKDSPDRQSLFDKENEDHVAKVTRKVKRAYYKMADGCKFTEPKETEEGRENMRFFHLSKGCFQFLTRKMTSKSIEEGELKLNDEAVKQLPKEMQKIFEEHKESPIFAAEVHFPEKYRPMPVYEADESGKPILLDTRFENRTPNNTVATVEVKITGHFNTKKNKPSVRVGLFRYYILVNGKEFGSYVEEEPLNISTYGRH